MADIGSLNARATLDNADFINAIKELGAQMQSGMDAAGSAFEGISEKIGAVGQALAGYELGKKMSEFASSCLEASAAAGKLQAAFEAINGPATSTTELLDKLENLKFTSMFDLESTLGPAAKDMLAMGISAQQTGVNIQALVDTAAAMKQSPAWIQSVADTLGHMNLQGEVTTRTMRQLTMDQVPAWQALADHIGTDIPGAMEKVKQHLVSTKDVNDAVVEWMEGKYSGAAAKIEGTWRGQLNLFQKLGETFKKDFGDAISAVLQKLTPIIEYINGLFKEFIDWFEKLPGPVKDAAVAFVAVAAAIPLVAAAIGILNIALEALGGSMVIATGGLALLVPALVLIGEWVYANWEPIVATVTDAWGDVKEIWGGIWADITSAWKTSTSGLGTVWHAAVDPIVKLITTVWDAVKTVWTTAWNGIVGSLQAAWGIITKALGGLGSVIGSFFSTFGAGAAAIKDGLSRLSTLGNVWQTVSGQVADAKAKTDAMTASQNALKTATANINEQVRLKAQADQQAAEAAKQAAAAEQQRADAIRATAAAIQGVAPALAAQLVASVGSVDSATQEAQKSMGTAWDTTSAKIQQQIIAAFALRDAYKTLGETATTALVENAGKADAAFALIAGSADATAGDIQVAMDKVYDAHKKVIDQQNTDLTDAFKNSQITATQYYAAIADRAQASLDQVKADFDAGKATEAAYWAAKQAAQDAFYANFKATTDSINAAYTALGLKTEGTLQADIQKWQDYAKTVAANSGEGTLTALQAQLTALTKQHDDLVALGKPVDTLNAEIETLRQKLEAAKTPAQQLTDAMKGLGLTSFADMNQSLTDMAANLVSVQNLQQQGLATDADVYAAQKKLQDQVTAEVNYMSQQWTDAYKNGDITQQQFYDGLFENSQKRVQQLTVEAQAMATEYGEGSTQAQTAIAKVNAAIAAMNKALTDSANQEVTDLGKAYQRAGANSETALNDMVTTAHNDFVAIATDAGDQSLAAKKAQEKYLLAVYDDVTARGGQWTTDQNNQLAQVEQQIHDSGTRQVAQWKGIYDGVTQAVGTAMSGLVDTLVTGKGSFQDVITGMWQDIAKACLNAFLTPVTTAIEKFIATTLADLLTGKGGLSDIESAFTNIGKTVSGLFPSSGGVQGMPGGVPASPGLGGVIPGFPSGGGAAGGGAGGVAGIAGGLTGVIGAVGSIGSMITGAIGDIQQAHANKVLGQIEQSTRYAYLLLGGQADQGIFGLLTAIREDLEWGLIYKAVANMSNEWISASPIIQGYLKEIYQATNLNILPVVVTIEGVLENIRSNTTDMSQVLDNFQSSGFGVKATEATAPGGAAPPQTVTVNVSPQGLTTAEAAKALGNQIATNLTGQLVTVK